MMLNNDITSLSYLSITPELLMWRDRRPFSPGGQNGIAIIALSLHIKASGSGTLLAEAYRVIDVSK